MNRILSLAAIFIAANAALAGETTLVKDRFQTENQNWDWHGNVENGEFVLTASDANQYSGSQALLKQMLKIGAPDALRIRLTVNKIAGEDASGINAEARIFLVPEPLKNPTFADPYNNPSALTLMLVANGAQNTLSIRLFKKTNQTEPGYGWPVLYSATLPLDSCFPLSLDWQLSPAAYKLTLGKPAQTVDGSRQEKWELGNEWKGDLRFIIRVVNLSEGTKSQLRISDFSATTGPIFE